MNLYNRSNKKQTILGEDTKKYTAGTNAFTKRISAYSTTTQNKVPPCDPASFSFDITTHDILCGRCIKRSDFGTAKS